jgi:hypothetical protein
MRTNKIYLVLLLHLGLLSSVFCIDFEGIWSDASNYEAVGGTGDRIQNYIFIEEIDGTYTVFFLDLLNPSNNFVLPAVRNEDGLYIFDEELEYRIGIDRTFQEESIFFAIVLPNGEIPRFVYFRFGEYDSTRL